MKPRVGRVGGIVVAPVILVGIAPLDPELESCLRTTLASIELPPLGGIEPLHIQYSFRFDDD